MAKRLFSISAAILMLAIAYHLGAHNVQAQSGGQIVAMAWEGAPERHLFAVTSDGAVYRYDSRRDTWVPHSNVFNGAGR